MWHDEEHDFDGHEKELEVHENGKEKKVVPSTLGLDCGKACSCVHRRGKGCGGAAFERSDGGKAQNERRRRKATGERDGDEKES